MEKFNAMRTRLLQHLQKKDFNLNNNKWKNLMQ